MRRIKKVSVTRYIITYLTGIILVVSFLMILLVNILANRMIYYDIQSTLIREMAGNGKNVHYEDGIVRPDEDFKYEDDGMYFQILGEWGEVLLGESPGEREVARESISQKLKMYEVDGKEYYIIDRVNRKLTQEAGEILYNRCIINKKNIDSKYQFVKYISYASILLVLASVLAVGLVISSKIAEPLKQMSKTAESIGKEGELSRRMKYDGKITELGILASTNNRMLERVEEMFENQKRFSSDVAHELRTPIAVLLAQCEYAKEYVSTKEEFDEAVDVLYRQAKRANGVISQLLNLNRLDEGRVTLDIEDADLDEMICSICDEIEFKEKGNVQFELNLSKARAELDIGLMYILLNNIIQNAVKYSSVPTKVRIETKCQEKETVIKVMDHGCGIKEEDLAHIFDPFYRVEKSRNSEGFGLGLSLAARIAKIHGGEISVESVWGEGSTFTLTLPVKR